MIIEETQIRLCEKVFNDLALRVCMGAAPKRVVGIEVTQQKEGAWQLFNKMLKLCQSRMRGRGDIDRANSDRSKESDSDCNCL